MVKKLMSGITLESIQFQSDVFFKELVSLFRELRVSKTEKAIVGNDFIITIEESIKHHTGLNCKLSLGGYGPAVGIPRVDKNHPFIASFIRNYIDDDDVFRAMKKADGIVKGTVSLATGKVSGIFSEIESVVHFPIKMLANEKYSDEELAAVTLHEIGHLITYYEFISRSVTTNQVLSALSRGIAKADDVEKRTAIIVSAQKALKLKEKGIDELTKSTKGDVVSAVIISQLIEQTRAELGNNIYDLNSWEYMADEYATRHQAGKHLITAFDKIYRESFHKSFRSTGAFIAWEALKLFLLLGGLVTGISIMFAAIIMLNDTDAILYDEPEARIRRVKQQIIQNLKDTTLSKDDVDRLNEDLKTIDNLLLEVNDRRQFISVVIDFISPSARRNRNEVLLQQELETIANNELFAKASQFKTLKV